MLSSFHLCLTTCTSLFSFDKPWNSAFCTVKYILLRSWLYVIHTHITCYSFSTYCKLQIKHILSSTFLFLECPVSKCNGRIPNLSWVRRDLLLSVQYLTYADVYFYYYIKDVLIIDLISTSIHSFLFKNL